MRRESSTVQLIVNDVRINRILIDPHVDKHADHIDDETIIHLVYQLHCRAFYPVSVQNNFEYFVTRIDWKKRRYKLVWLTENNETYIGIITTFRDRRLK